MSFTNHLFDKYGPLLTLKEINAIWNVPLETIKYHLIRHDIPHFIIDRKYYVPKKDIDNYIASKLEVDNLTWNKYVQLDIFKPILYNDVCKRGGETLVRKDIEHYLSTEFIKYGYFERLCELNGLDFICYLDKKVKVEQSGKEIVLNKIFFIKVKCCLSINCDAALKIKNRLKQGKLCCIVSSLHDFKRFLRDRFNLDI